MIKNLAIKGGGVRGIAFVGALRELDSANILSGIQRVAGTSAGSIVAAMLCAGYTVDQIEELMYGLDFTKFEEGYNPIRIVTHYGLYSGDYILDFIHKFLSQSPKNLTADARFIDLKNAGGRDLFVFASDLNTFSLTEFSADKTPNVKIAEAVRASMSIPIFFKVWQFSDGQPTDHLYVDGGTIFNYPLTFFDDVRFCSTPDYMNAETIGLYLYATQAREKRELGFDQLMHFSRHLFETMLDSQDVDFEADESQMARSVMINDLGIMTTDFHLTQDDMRNLVASGKDGVLLYLKNNPSLQPTLLSNLSQSAL